MLKDATIDSTGEYRYILKREWNPNLKTVVFVMLNPSTADANIDDRTIEKCIKFAKSWGYGSLEVVNLFAYRSTDPKKLRDVGDPVGEENDNYLLEAVNRADKAVLAWGNNGRMLRRYKKVLELLSSKELYCLGITKEKQPKHPLYVLDSTQLISFKGC